MQNAVCFVVSSGLSVTRTRIEQVKLKIKKPDRKVRHRSSDRVNARAFTVNATGHLSSYFRDSDSYYFCCWCCFAQFPRATISKMKWGDNTRTQKKQTNKQKFNALIAEHLSLPSPIMTQFFFLVFSFLCYFQLLILLRFWIFVLFFIVCILLFLLVSGWLWNAIRTRPAKRCSATQVAGEIGRFCVV